jgi:hypothetical protein
MDTKTKIGLFIGALALSGSAVYDANTFSSGEISRVKSHISALRPTEDYILGEILNGRTPQFDVNEMSTEEISSAYIEVAKKLGDNLEGDERNLYKRIRSEAQKRQ